MRSTASSFLTVAAGALVLAAAGLDPPAAADVPAAYAAGSRAFVADMADSLGYGRDELAALMAQARYRQDIIDAMNRPYEAKPWREYRQLFLTPERIDGGVAFLGEHADLLRRVEAAYGVPPEIITAIIGIETNYGGTLGSHRVLDALSTLGFAYPRRAAFFSKELGEFLRLAREEDVDPVAAKGSYAGAVGMPQFIPSSYRAYAVDFDQDGRRDLWDSPADVLGSVGNYLAQHGWRRGGPVAAPALLKAGPPAGVPVAEKRPAPPEQTLAALNAAGVVADTAMLAAAPAPDTRAALLALDGDGTEYWLGFQNFYAITRYNHSNLYAMAVLELSREIAARAQTTGGDDAAG
ncbi:lytic murein transglycosylase B [uncultured Thiohalocapsa sp.]|mgnify:CR=1 FL=1|uniref:lytic murein transglycosylase B n=1 Tax=uncultured Thiohalocapsa sp. TaxID=768990 RepID=UPI0025CCE189|nr:lytic murein transglycosylase B [uncultured Thiohalocapsa sp.]